MSTYELDDHDVDLILTDLRGRNSATSEIADRIEAQIPLPVPTKPHAVVRTASGVYTLGHKGNHLAWLGTAPDPHEPGDWYEADAIGRITEVLFEGVDL